MWARRACLFLEGLTLLCAVSCDVLRLGCEFVLTQFASACIAGPASGRLDVMASTTLCFCVGFLAFFFHCAFVRAQILDVRLVLADVHDCYSAIV